MAFSNQVIAIARETKLVMAVETTPGTQVLANASMTLVLPNAAGSVNQMLRHIPDPQYRNTRSRLLPIVGTYEAGKWSFPALFRTKAASGEPAVSQLDVLLQCAFGQASSTDATWFGATAHRAYMLQPAQLGGTQFPSFTAWFQQGHTAFYIAGATVDQMEINVVGNEVVAGAFSGEFMRMGWCGTDTIAAGDSAGDATDLYVVDAKKYFLANAADSLYIMCVDPVALVPRTGWASGVKVTAINYTTNVLTTVEAPVVGVNRVAGDLIVPYINLPSEDTTFLPMVGKYGLVRLAAFVDYTAANLPSPTQVVSKCKLTLKNGVKYHPDLKDGSLFPSEYVAPSPREVTGELEMFFYRNVLDFNYKNQTDPIATDYVILPAQDRNGSGGRLMQIHMPQVVYETPNIQGEDEKTATIAFNSHASSAYDNELALVFVGS